MRRLATTPDGRPIFDGVPVAGDVDKLFKRYGVPEEGTEISYHEIGEIIGASYPQNRWHTVTHAWRKRMERQHNCCIAPHPDKPDTDCMFLVLNPSQRLQRGHSFRRSAIRKVKRSHMLIAKTDRNRLDKAEQGVYDHEMDRTARVILADRQATFAPRPPKAIKDPGEAGRG